MAIKVTLFIVFILAFIVFTVSAIVSTVCYYSKKDECESYKRRRDFYGEDIKEEDMPKKPKTIKSWVFSILAVVMLVLTIFIPGNIHQVNTGEVAVVRHMGKVSGIREAGIHWDFYMTNSYQKFDTKVREIKIDTQTYSKDNQIIGVQADLQYTIDSAQVDKIAAEYGKINKLESKIKSIALDNIKSVFAQNTATDVINNRSQISANISQIVNNSINESYYVNIKTIVLTNIDFTDDFEAAVAAKVAAAQEAEKAENEARKAEIEAEAAKQVAILKAEAELETAKKNADAKLYQAEKEAEANLVLAQAEANATKVKAVEVARMLGFNIIETVSEDGITYDIDFTGVEATDERYKLMINYLQYVQYLETWDGTLPVTLVGDDTATIVIPSVN